jgi:hypothetical protein
MNHLLLAETAADGARLLHAQVQRQEGLTQQKQAQQQNRGGSSAGRQM